MARVLTPAFGSMKRAAKQEFVNAQIEAHKNGGLLVFSKTY